MQKLSFEKGDTIKFICGDQKINDTEVIHIDKNITSSIQEGDKIVIDSSGCILKVLKIDYYRKEKQYCVGKRFREAKSFSNLPFVNINNANNEFSGDENINNDNNKNNSHQQENLFWEKNRLFNTDDDEESVVSSSFGYYQNNSSSNLNSALESGFNIINKNKDIDKVKSENSNEKEKEKDSKFFDLRNCVENSPSCLNLNNIILGNESQSESNFELGENDNIILCGNIESNISPIVKKVNEKKINKNLNLNNQNSNSNAAASGSNNTSGKNLTIKNEPIIELIDEESRNEEKFDTPFFDVDHNFNSDAEETFKNKQNKITEVYKSIVKKHVSCRDTGVAHSKFGEKEDEKKHVVFKEGNFYKIKIKFFFCFYLTFIFSFF